MANIPAEQKRALFTQDVVALYEQIPTAFAFLQGFFPIVTKNTRYLTYDVQRSGEPVAIDIMRGQEANLNTFSIHDNKIVDPPYYAESVNATSLDGYDVAIAAQMMNQSANANWMENVLKRLKQLQDKIDRAKELQCAQVLKNGIVTLMSGDSIDFKRKAALVTSLASGSRWDTHADTADPYADIETYCMLMRALGKAQGGNFNILFGQKAYAALIRTDSFKERAKWLNTKLDDIRPQLRNTVQGSYHGRLDCGSFTVDAWTYTEGYETTAGDSSTFTQYLEPKNMVVLPDTPKFIMGHALVPQLPPDGLAGLPETAPVKDQEAYVISQYLDRKKKTWEFEIGSCPIALPIAIDQMATVQVTNA
jgi:hypothetical protein